MARVDLRQRQPGLKQRLLKLPVIRPGRFVHHQVHRVADLLDQRLEPVRLIPKTRPGAAHVSIQDVGKGGGDLTCSRPYGSPLCNGPTTATPGASPGAEGWVFPTPTVKE